MYIYILWLRIRAEIALEASFNIIVLFSFKALITTTITKAKPKPTAGSTHSQNITADSNQQ